MLPTRKSLIALLSLAVAAPAAAQTQASQAGNAGKVAQPAGQQILLQWGDFDADGLTDALAITPERGLKLMRNSGDGGFEDATAKARLAGVSGASFGVWQDYDQDGRVDLFVGTQAGPSRLFRNEGGSFIDVTSQVGIDADGVDHSASWVDYDGDGRLDLHLNYDASNVFFHALPGGTFERIALPATLVEPSTAQTSILVNPVVKPAASAAAEADQGAPGGRQGSGRRPVYQSNSSVGGGGALSGAEGESAGTVTSDLGVPTSLGLIAQGLWDLETGDIVRASVEPTLGELYPLGDDFFVQQGTGDIGVGTINPERAMHLVSSGMVPFLIDSAVQAGLELRTAGQPSSFSIFHGGDDALTFHDSTEGLTRMRIDGDDGDVVVTSRLEVPTISTPTNTVRVEGLVRAGSELGTDQSPTVAFDYEGVMTRRIASTIPSPGGVVARSQYLRLVRDGSNGLFSVEWDEGAIPDQVIYGTGLTSAGAIVPIVFNLGAPTATGSQQLYTDPDVVRLELSFGTTFNIRDISDVTLLRTAGDFWWVGTVTSTWDQ